MNQKLKLEMTENHGLRKIQAEEDLWKSSSPALQLTKGVVKVFKKEV